jgi:hypothetical protein
MTRMETPDFSQPCPDCAAGRHLSCTVIPCGCIVIHPGDAQVTAGFKRVKQRLHPERDAWTKGGFAAGPA